MIYCLSFDDYKNHKDDVHRYAVRGGKREKKSLEIIIHGVIYVLGVVPQNKDNKKMTQKEDTKRVPLVL